MNLARIECDLCGQWIERRGMKKHRGSKKCIEAQKRSGKQPQPSGHREDTSKCPECGSDLKILTSSTKIIRENGAYVPQDQIQAALDQGDTMYCDRCLVTYH